jgi:hypothetical protein
MSQEIFWVEIALVKGKKNGYDHLNIYTILVCSNGYLTRQKNEIMVSGVASLLGVMPLTGVPLTTVDI